MAFFGEYGLFLLELLTIIIMLLLVIRLSRSGGGMPSGKQTGHLHIECLQTHFDHLAHTVEDASLEAKQVRKANKARRKEEKAKAKAKVKTKADTESSRKRVFVLDFDGDIKASGATGLREEVTAIVASRREGDEVILRLASPGGTVTGYGLAASQLARLKSAKIKLTVAVDQVAASGGYMMACVADEIIAAPFAILGSIGVVTTIPNVNRLLKRNHVDVEMLTAGEYKRTLTLIGENTDEGRAKMQSQLEEMHQLFKDFVAEHRPSLDMTVVATGEYWQGTRAKELGLIDGISTSDDRLLSLRKDADLLRLEWIPPTSVGSRLRDALSRVLGGTLDATRQAEIDARLP